MLVHSLASKYARFVVLVRQMYWTPPSDHWTLLLKSDDLFFREPRDIGPPLSKILDTPLGFACTQYKLFHLETGKQLIQIRYMYTLCYNFSYRHL